MSHPADGDITQALIALRDEVPGAMDRLLPMVYEQLHRIAQRQLGTERSGHTLSPTGLVHETYLRLIDQRRTGWQDRGHFYAVAATAMRRILIDHARRYRAARRGGGPGGRPAARLSLDDVDIPVDERADLLVALDEALQRLSDIDPRMAQVVECRFFAGLTEEETAMALSVSRRTVAREWATAKGWLYEALRDDAG